MKYLTFLMCAFCFNTHAFVDFEYPAGVCLKEEYTGRKKNFFEVGTDRKQVCCKIEEKNCQNCYIKGLYFISGSGEKKNCSYPKLAVKKKTSLRKIASDKNLYKKKQLSKLPL